MKESLVRTMHHRFDTINRVVNDLDLKLTVQHA